MPTNLLSLADETLLDAHLTTGDPEGQTERLRLTTTAPPRIIQRYNVAPPKDDERDFVWCAHCGRPTHWKGYVVELASGEQVNLGHQCGKEQFGFEFGTIENQFNALVDRQGLLRRLLTIRELIPELRSAAHTLSSADSTQAFDTSRAAIRGTWPKVWRALQSASGAGRLISQVLVADPDEVARQKASVRRYYERQMTDAPTRTARERLRKEMQGALNEVRHVSRVLETDHGPLHGTEFLRLQGTLEAGWQALHRQAHSICQTIEVESGGLPNAALRAISRAASDLLDASVTMADCQASCGAFWQRDNLVRVAKWWNASADGSPVLEVSGGGFRDETGAAIDHPPALHRLPEALTRLRVLRDRRRQQS